MPPPKITRLGENIVLICWSKTSKRNAHSCKVNSSFFLIESAQKNSIISPFLWSNFQISKLGINFPLLNRPDPIPVPIVITNTTPFFPFPAPKVTSAIPARSASLLM